MANEPRAYRESIAAVVGQLRPDADVRCAEPEDLDGQVARFSPDVVVCSRVTMAVEGRVRVWVELYPDHTTRSVVSVGGERAEFAEIQLPDLLSVVDKADGIVRQS